MEKEVASRSHNMQEFKDTLEDQLLNKQTEYSYLEQMKDQAKQFELNLKEHLEQIKHITRSLKGNYFALFFC